MDGKVRKHCAQGKSLAHKRFVVGAAQSARYQKAAQPALANAHGPQNYLAFDRQ